MKNNNGIWIGENSTIAIVGEMRIVFLRLEKDIITSILYRDEAGVVSAAYGHGNGDIDKEHTHTAAIICDSGNIFKNNDEANDFVKMHSSDRVSYNEKNKKLIYTTYDNRVFENTLAEKIEINDFERVNEIDNTLPIAEKMAKWNIKVYFSINSNQIRAGIDTRKYSVFYNMNLSENEFIYCRVGQQGYCEKGWAMFPTIQIRHHYTGMIEDNLSSINDYKPNKDWFIVDGCSFPEDGGWYWSIKEVTDNVIYLQGCGGDVYEIHRK